MLHFSQMPHICDISNPCLRLSQTVALRRALMMARMCTKFVPLKPVWTHGKENPVNGKQQQ